MQPNSLNIKAVLFDLDETLLDRKNSLIDFVIWQVKHQLKLNDHQATHFIQRFLMLDNHGKPDPAIFHMALAELNVLPEQALFVGDDPIADVEGARKAGLKSIYFNQHHYKNTVQALATITDLRELKYLLDQSFQPL